MATVLSLERLEDRTTPSSMGFREEPILPNIDAEMKVHLQEVVQRGLALGNRPNVFVKVGDSHTATPNFLSGFGSPFVGAPVSHPELESVLAVYRTPVDSSGANSFNRMTTSAGGGWTALQALAHLPGELAAIRPSVVLIQVGHNDNVLSTEPAFRTQLTLMVQTVLAQGAIPILSTNHIVHMAPEISNPRIDALNEVIVDIAQRFKVPLLNWRAATPDEPGDVISLLDIVTIHLNSAPTGTADLSPFGLNFGNNLRNLLTLQALEKVQRIVLADGEPDLPLPRGDEPWVALEPSRAYAAVSSAEGEPGVVRIFDTESGTPVNHFSPFGRAFRGGASVTLGDLNGDGVPDLVVGAGVGGGPSVRVLDGRDGSTMHEFFAYEPTFRGGINVATGDLDGDGIDDLVVGTGVGGGPRVRAFLGHDLSQVVDEMVFEPTFRGGVRTAIGDFDGDGMGELVTAAGVGGGPRVRVLSIGNPEPDMTILADFFAYSPALGSGVYVGTGDFNGDGVDELITGPGTGAAHVLVFDRPGDQPTHSFYANESSGQGVQIAVTERPDRPDDLLTYSHDLIPLMRRFEGDSFTFGSEFRIGNLFGQPIGDIGG